MPFNTFCQPSCGKRRLPDVWIPCCAGPWSLAPPRAADTQYADSTDPTQIPTPAAFHKEVRKNPQDEDAHDVGNGTENAVAAAAAAAGARVAAAAAALAHNSQPLPVTAQAGNSTCYDGRFIHHTPIKTALTPTDHLVCPCERVDGIG